MTARHTIGILPLGRSTFDVPFAEEKLSRMLAVLEQTGHRVAGPRALLLDTEAARAAVKELEATGIDQVLILQVTFTDASMAVEIAGAFAQPLSIWAIPEPRTGGRLRLNSFCGMNLATHALGLNGREFSYLYAAPDDDGIVAAVGELLDGKRVAKPVMLAAATAVEPAGKRAVAALRGARIGRIGAHPEGFDTCRYDKNKLEELAAISVDELQLPLLFDTAGNVSAQSATALRAEAAEIADGLDAVDQGQLDRSLRLKGALETIRDKGGYDAFAIRCWPETFTEYGGAVCGPVAMMGEARVPCACEADVYGAITSLLLQEVAGAPAFLTDLVDIDEKDDTGVVWHCGQAPMSMAEPDILPSATIHNNRRMPLLFEFPLRAGRVTFFRISQARGETTAVIGGGVMLKRPLAFTGTAGVVRFDAGSKQTLSRIMGAAIEHHMALAYGDHRAALASAAAELKIPVLTL
jgi:L-fucose isomerase-like protein